ncbi:baseplate assembly protein [Aeromonas phage AerS_266]|nr:baseplate assembly protein [Aeromonas phage AerS_266]
MNVLECYGVGTVMQDKDNDSDEVFVHCPGIFSGADGEALATVEEKKTDIKTPTGDATSSFGLSSNGIPCKWMAFNTNRITPPNVRKGSKVVVYKFSGSNQYRWMYFGMDGTMRLETVVYAWSSSPNVNENSPLTPDNYYILMISTHTGKIQLLTGQGNGEKASYALTLDTANAIFSLTDSEENLMALNTMEHTWSFSNQEKSVIAIDKKKILISCEEQLAIKAKENITIHTKTLDVEVGQTFNLNVGQATNMTSPKFNFNGDLIHTGNTTQDGEYSATGKISSDTDCVSAGKSGKGHRHTDVQGGNGISGPVQ